MWIPFYDVATKTWFLFDEQTRREHPARFNYEPSVEEINEHFPIEVYVEDRFKTIELPTPTVACDIIVNTSHDPTMKYETLFFVEIKPKGFTFPEDFFIARGIELAKELEEYLGTGEDYFSGEENYYYWDEDECEEYLQQLPAPFNKYEAYVKLTWTKDDVHFTKEGEALWNVHKTTYTRAELEAKTVDVLKIIARVKEAESGGNKPDIIASILQAQGNTTPEELEDIAEKAEEKLKKQNLTSYF